VARVTLVTRRGCHLCDVAHADLERLRARIPFELEAVDVDGDPQLIERWGDTVPVVLVDGRLACKVRVDAERLARRLAG